MTLRKDCVRSIGAARNRRRAMNFSAGVMSRLGWRGGSLRARRANSSLLQSAIARRSQEPPGAPQDDTMDRLLAEVVAGRRADRQRDVRVFDAAAAEDADRQR